MQITEIEKGDVPAGALWLSRASEAWTLVTIVPAAASEIVAG